MFEIIEYIFLHMRIKLKINNRKIGKTMTTVWGLSHILLNNVWLKKTITVEVRRYFEVKIMKI